MEEWEEKLDIDIEKYKKRRKGYLISIIIILIIFTIIAQIIGFFVFLWPGVLFTILGGSKG